TGTGLVVTNSGNVGIGTTSPVRTLHVRGGSSGVSINAYGGMILESNTHQTLSMVSPANTQQYLGFGGGAIVDAYMAWEDGTRGEKLTVVNGSAGVYLAVGGTSWTSNSDIRLKENVETAQFSLQKILKLRPVTYNLISVPGNITEIGFIAQEVEPYLPEVVVKPKNDDGYFGLNYDRFAPYLVGAIQEQQTQITGITNNQNKIVEQLTGQLADQSLSVDSKLQLIGSSLDELTINQIKKIKEQILENKASISSVSADLEILQDQYATIQDQYSTLSEILLVADGVYDFKKGILKSSGIVAGAFTVKVTPDKPKTIGEAYICPVGFTGDNCDIVDALADGKSVLVDTLAVTATAKIFVTAENDTDGNIWVEKKIDNSGFEIFIKPLVPITEKIKINWWIVEKVSE
ncbi:MAG: tail fiber domain-containing protein, partial [Candidatus Moraniibacteriota bacterium]